DDDEDVVRLFVQFDFTHTAPLGQQDQAVIVQDRASLRHGGRHLVVRNVGDRGGYAIGRHHQAHREPQNKNRYESHGSSRRHRGASLQTNMRSRSCLTISYRSVEAEYTVVAAQWPWMISKQRGPAVEDTCPIDTCVCATDIIAFTMVAAGT